MVICIVGQIASGKSTVAELMKEKGYKTVEMGDVVREEMSKRNLEIDSKSLRNFSAELRSSYGNDVVARLTLKELRRLGGTSMSNTVITGMRSTYEEAYFKKSIKGLVVVAVLAPESIRFARIKKRNKPDDPKTLEEFRAIEKKELGGFSAKGDFAHGILHAIETADYVLLNTGTTAQLRKDVYSLLEAIESQHKYLEKHGTREHAYNKRKG
ncbi:MAG: AAA family ATPase [Candidatus Micrarchaeaceae archaeon]